MEKSPGGRNPSKMTELRKLLVSIFAITAIVVLELYALSKGIDGKLFGLVIAAIAGLGGYTLSSLVRQNGRVS